MVPKENFLTYSTQFIFFIIRLDIKTCHWYMQKDPHHRGVDIWNYMRTCITFYVFCLFIYLLLCSVIFSHFYICNVWFALANNKVLNFSFFILTIFLPVNTHKFPKYYFTFCYKWCFWKQPFRVFPGIVIHFRYTLGIPHFQ